MKSVLGAGGTRGSGVHLDASTEPQKAEIDPISEYSNTENSADSLFTNGFVALSGNSLEASFKVSSIVPSVDATADKLPRYPCSLKETVERGDREGREAAVSNRTDGKSS